jgi:hypothetical protein
MHCANPNCMVIADELLKGTLKLVEFETAPDERLLYSSGGFPVCSARTRYFWLCQKCSHMFAISKWNSSGVILERLPENDPRYGSIAARKPASQESPDDRRPERLYPAA